MLIQGGASSHALMCGKVVLLAGGWVLPSMFTLSSALAFLAGAAASWCAQLVLRWI